MSEQDATILAFRQRGATVNTVSHPDYTLRPVTPIDRGPSGQEHSPLYLNLLELQKRPGEFMAIGTYGNRQSARSAADQYRAARDGRPRRKMRELPPGDRSRWIFAHQELDDGRWALVACWKAEGHA